jgi:hypothetical protein
MRIILDKDEPQPDGCSPVLFIALRSAAVESRSTGSMTNNLARSLVALFVDAILAPAPSAARS